MDSRLRGNDIDKNIMAKAFKRLQSVLKLEAQQGYKNKAVVGGIGQFAAFWVDQAREEAVDEGDRAFVEQTSAVLADYGNLQGDAARSESLNNLLGKLKQRQERVDKISPPKPSPHRPPPQKKKAPAQKQQRQQPQPQQKKQQPQPKRQQQPKKKQQPKKGKNKRVTIPHLPGEKSVPSFPGRSVEPDPDGLRQSVTIIKGVGPVMADKLAKLGIENLCDLLHTFPHRYDDYTLMKPIQELVYGETVTVIGTVWETRAQRTRNNQTIIRATINDGTGSVQATWFNQPWLAKSLESGMHIVISGKLDQYLGRLVFNSPAWEPLEMEPLRTRRMVPIYPLTKGLTAAKMREMMRTAVSQWSAKLPEPMPESIRQRHELYGTRQAMQQIHFPDSSQTMHKARQRIIFDELFMLQLGMQEKRKAWRAEPGMALSADGDALAQFYAALPYTLTDAQHRVIKEILGDMTQSVPMNRLLQGDVGSGKTVVAAAALLTAVKAGAQAALMVPTSILAEQHYAGLNELLSAQGVAVALLTGGTSAKEKAQIYTDLEAGYIQVIIGTHALIQDGVTFDKLALTIIDEQHRFGVDQRAALRDKGARTESPEGENGRFNPHMLVMSATPIPRTLALSMYGDLDISVIDEMPPGREEIKTRWMYPTERQRAYNFVENQIQKGRQAYIIYPLVEESDKIEAKAAVEEYERLQTTVFPKLKLGLIHGRLRADEKEAVMRSFNAGEIDVLVATAVIEVGVDVPNSTVMMIEGANRFGLAQLHQFRGRVGRGEHQSYCILIAEEVEGTAKERLQALEQSNDGFALAEKDLEIRGPGEFLGRRQSGLPELKLASLSDMEMLKMARTEAETIFATDPDLAQPEHALLREQVNYFWESVGDVS